MANIGRKSCRTAGMEGNLASGVNDVRLREAMYADG